MNTSGFEKGLDAMPMIELRDVELGEGTMTMTRRTIFRALAAAPALALAAKSEPIQAKRDVVKQAELQTVLDLYNQCEALAGAIRLRLEAGAQMERGKLGVSTQGQEPLQWYVEHGLIGQNRSVDSFVGLAIGPVEDFAHHFEMLRRYPDFPYKGITLV